jgi:hypothetical protein
MLNIHQFKYENTPSTVGTWALYFFVNDHKNVLVRIRIRLRFYSYGTSWYPQSRICKKYLRIGNTSYKPGFYVLMILCNVPCEVYNSRQCLLNDSFY